MPDTTSRKTSAPLTLDSALRRHAAACADDVVTSWVSKLLRDEEAAPGDRPQAEPASKTD